MDDETNQLLRQLIDAQKEQTELLRKNLLPLWTRIRFSLLGLFVLMTLVAVGIGITAFAIRSLNSAPTTAPPMLYTPPPPSATEEDLFGPVTPSPFTEDPDIDIP